MKPQQSYGFIILGETRIEATIITMPMEKQVGDNPAILFSLIGTTSKRLPCSEAGDQAAQEKGGSPVVPASL